MKIDVLVAEIGSTTTIVNAFNIHQSNPSFLGRGVANTTVASDVTIGLNLAIKNLQNNLHTDSIEYSEMFATSSAAGGLKVTVHGLVYEMTVRASKEAALNAGANIHLVTAGKVKHRDLKRIKNIQPNIIIVAGGTDYGEYETALYNIEKILHLNLDIPIIYAGNIDNHHDIKEFFAKHHKQDLLKIVENVYPRVDYLNILPLRKVIYQTFEENIIHAPGMNHIHDMVNQNIMPTPGSVMEATMMLYEHLGNVMTIDVGGATTDIHSVAEPSDEYKEYQEGEPRSKRTVEGDLGVFINHKNVVRLFEDNTLSIASGLSEDTLNKLLENYTYIPTTKDQKTLVYQLTKKCTELALDRHVGDLRRVFTSSGQKIIPEGKDLTKVQFVILTGGALVNLSHTEKIIDEYIRTNHRKLLPNKNVTILKDHDYIMASLGVLSLKYPEKSVRLLRKTLRIE
ncbi:glutamate mutase L [Candidatus Xianfuyuplasma coldseepsis]|uniref:DNA mismatch repair protein MutL n=1 Tax=Candidatus Xianfuyuplasma coldseepsis TaxID=2782163 RepID=A0A7L7KSH3_9MOLU|nr:glutamate mutase L [Xianfuyuplasma coldseepsis]QMS85166.1 DNA mismatch repair protein MutL [Xianfuyuplasma coldseepsis]